MNNSNAKPDNIINNSRINTRRRKLMKVSLASGLLFASGTYWLSSGPGIHGYSIKNTLDKLNKLVDTKIKALGEWSVGQIFNHLAQSIEYSMTGYPEHKSLYFKKTIGSAAFSIFNHRGEMSHNLAEIIPGAPLIDANESQTKALARLMSTLTSFDQFSGPLKAHFAYGELTKKQYINAHIMHINNHFQELSFHV